MNYAGEEAPGGHCCRQAILLTRFSTLRRLTSTFATVACHYRLLDDPTSTEGSGKQTSNIYFFIRLVELRPIGLLVKANWIFRSFRPYAWWPNRLMHFTGCTLVSEWRYCHVRQISKLTNGAVFHPADGRSNNSTDDTGWREAAASAARRPSADHPAGHCLRRGTRSANAICCHLQSQQA